jgi:hypothetical protein
LQWLLDLAPANWYVAAVSDSAYILSHTNP